MITIKGITFVSCLLASTAAGAQTASDTQPAQGETAQAETSIQDIIVTAQRMAESSQKTPLVLEVLTADALNRAGVSRATDIAKLLPGIQIGTGGPALQVFIRGVGDLGSSAISNPAVAANIDGVYAARSQSVGGNFFDLERVEVLKGPQGTLYGRNASGGAINLIPVSPKLGKFEGYVRLTGQNYSGVLGEAALNIPVTDTVAIRAGVQTANRDGYLSDGTTDDVHQAARLQLLFEPNAGVSLRLYGSYVHQGGRGVGFVLRNPNGTSVSGPTPLADPWTAITSPQANAIIQQSPLYRAAALNLFDGGQISQDITSWNAHAQLDWKLGDITLSVLPAYQHTRLDYHTIAALNYDTRTYDGTPESSEAISVETRLAGRTGRFKWVAGLFYYHEDQVDTLHNNQGLIQNTYIKADGLTESEAVFGQATFDITQYFRLTGGIRYTHERKSLIGSGYDASPSLSCTVPTSPDIGPAGACLSFAIKSRYKTDKVNYRAGVEFDVARDSMFYATVATGFKSGGISYSPAPPFRAEQLVAYEVGVKNRFFGGKLQVNAELFYWDYKDHQESLLTQVQGLRSLVTTQTFINAGAAHAKGLNVDIIARAVPSNKIRASVEYNKSTFDTFRYRQYAAFTSTGCLTSADASVPVGRFGPLLNVDCSGKQLTHAPDWSGAIGDTQTISLGSAGSLDIGFDLTFAASRWLSADFVPNARAPAYASLSLNATFYSSNEKLSISAFARNVTNEAIYNGGLQSPFIPGLYAASISDPRTYGMTVGYRF